MKPNFKKHSNYFHNPQNFSYAPLSLNSLHPCQQETTDLVSVPID